MRKVWTVWSPIGVVATSVLALSACSVESQSEPAAQDNSETGDAVTPNPAITPAPATMAHGEGEGEGEGEGSTSDIDLATNDRAYLTQLALMRGHLLVGVELYRQGDSEAAITHMKHPESELYAQIAPAFGARGVDGFADELSALANAVESGAEQSEVEAAYTALIDAIGDCERAVKAEASTAGARLLLAADTVRVAADEYAIGVVDGKLANAHEYQDAYGFVQTARTILNAADTTGPTEQVALEQAAQTLSDLSDMWPAITPPDDLPFDSARIYGAAARVEILGLGIQ